MKNVNLLPEWYLLQHRQRRNLYGHLAVKVVLGCLILSSIYLGRRHNDALTQQYHQLQDQLTQIHDPTPALVDQESKFKSLEELQGACRELGKPIPMSAVIQQIQNDMTQDMALCHVMIDVHSEPVKGTGLVGDSHNPPRYHDVAHLNVMGIAPRDAAINQLFAKISSNQLFNEVTLNYMRDAILKGYCVRQFEIQMQMDLERLTTEDPDTLANAASLAPGENYAR